MPVSLKECLQDLTQSGLIPAAEVKAFLGGLPPAKRPADGTTLAQLLVQSGKLTKYQAAVVAHVAAHELGAAAYAIKAVRAAVPKGEAENAGRLECQWQREQLPEAIRELVLDDQRRRNDICWSVFDC